MAGWSRQEALAVGLPSANIDTDQLMPARFMSTPRSDGYGKFLLHDLRSEGFPLDGTEGARIIIAGRNFGCGSSREGAVYALVDYGIRVVVAPSFGDIFASNASNNELLPARVTPDDAEALLAAVPDTAIVDLGTREISIGALRVQFEIDDVWRTKIMNGWDDIDLTAQFSERIDAYKTDRMSSSHWTWPRRE